MGRRIMRMVVTGAAGFIGSHLVERLLADGHPVRAFVRDADRARRALPLGEVLREAGLIATTMRGTEFGLSLRDSSSTRPVALAGTFTGHPPTDARREMAVFRECRGRASLVSERSSRCALPLQAVPHGRLPCRLGSMVNDR